MAPKRQFKTLKACEGISAALTLVNVLMIIASLQAEIKVPLMVLATTGFMAILWFVCAAAAEHVKELHKLNDKGDPKEDEWWK